MEQYEKEVINARENKLDKRFANSIIEHARILIIKNTLNANKKVENSLIQKFLIGNDTNERVNYIVNDNNTFRYEYSDKNIQHGVVNAMFEKIKLAS